MLYVALLLEDFLLLLNLVGDLVESLLSLVKGLKRSLWAFNFNFLDFGFWLLFLLGIKGWALVGICAVKLSVSLEDSVLGLFGNLRVHISQDFVVLAETLHVVLQIASGTA